jgi:8-oxo-dGTP pyrophosphatase MutT (NUDIX family)
MSSAGPIVSHYLVSVKPPTPVTPSPAATVVLLRDRAADAIEVLMMQRHQKSKFAAGDFVFPGGKVEADDNPADAVAWCRGLDLEKAASVLGLESSPATALGYWVGAIRETFEEVGVLLATDADGRPPRLDAARVAEYRRACQTDNRAFWTMVRAEKLMLATDRLVYFAHWVTPSDLPLRFDTRFFAAPAPQGQEPIGDEHEVIGLRWLSPREALDAHAGGEISLRYPTIRNLMLFEDAPSTEEALRRLQGRVVTVIQPRVVIVDGKRKPVIPGDPGY